MDIKNYTSFFHDGSIFDIIHTGDRMTISMESAEMDKEDLIDDMILSENDRIKGRLHIEGIKNIKEDDKPYSNVFVMKYEDAEIFRFKLNQNNVELHILWNSFPPKPGIKDFSTVEIEAEKIWWENIPDMVDPSS